MEKLYGPVYHQNRFPGYCMDLFVLCVFLNPLHVATTRMYVRVAKLSLTATLRATLHIMLYRNNLLNGTTICYMYMMYMLKCAVHVQVCAGYVRVHVKCTWLTVHWIYTINVHVHVFVFVFVCVYACVRIGTVCMYVCQCACMCVSVHVCVSVCVC